MLFHQFDGYTRLHVSQNIQRRLFMFELEDFGFDTNVSFPLEPTLGVPDEKPYKQRTNK